MDVGRMLPGGMSPQRPLSCQALPHFRTLGRTLPSPSGEGSMDTGWARGILGLGSPRAQLHCKGHRIVPTLPRA